MKFNGKLLVFLAAWLATVGGGFFLPNMEALAANCNACQYCQDLTYADVYFNGQELSPNGYFGTQPGQPDSQAFDGGGCNDTTDWIYQSEDCHTFANCNRYDTQLQANTYIYANPTFTCDLPAGATPEVREFNGGPNRKFAGQVEQYACPVAIGSQPVP